MIGATLTRTGSTPFHRRPALRALLTAIAALLLLLAPGSARAIQSVAVLDLDGYGIDYETAQVMTQGLRDGFLEEATFDPLSGYDISEGLSVGQGDSIRRARELLAEARQKMDAGDTSGALRQLAEVLSIHEAAWSWVGRRPELADAHFFTALALSKLGRTTEAVDHLVECLYLYPAYDQGRAVGTSGAIMSLFSRARTQLEEAERRTVPGSRIATIGDRLGAKYVVAGYIVADGTVHVGLYQDGRLVTETTDYAEELPLYPGDPFFYDLAVLLVGGEHSTTPYAAPIGQPSTTEPEFGDFHEIPTVESSGSTTSTTSSIGTSDGGHLTDQGSSYESSRRTHRRRSEHTMSGIRYERKPVVETWWFWTGVTVVVGGGATGLYLLLREDVVVTEDPVEQDSYTITLDPSGVEAR
jgi:tetratricopeptide (TPR) repeat protein